MPSPAGKLDSLDKARWVATTATVGGTTVGGTVVGGAIATLIVGLWWPDATPEQSQAVQTLAVAGVMMLSFVVGLGAEWLRLKFSDTRGT